MNMNLKNKRVTVVGLGVSGLSAAKLLIRLGARVSVTDSGRGESIYKNREELCSMGVDVELGRHTEGFVKGRDLVVVSPGVDKNALPIIWAEKEGIPIIGEIELAFSFCKAPIIAITGSNGKTTVTTMTGELLEAGGIKSYVCGNIGLPFCDIAMDADFDNVVVLEVSSFQLTRIINFKPKVSVILNVTENHLDKHENLQEYLDSKLRIFKNQSAGDRTVLNYDDPNLVLRNFKGEILPPTIRRGQNDKKKCHSERSEESNLRGIAVPPTSDVLYFSRFKEVRGAWTDEDSIFLNVDGTKVKVCTKGEVSLKGEHNIENIMAAVIIASCSNVPLNTMREIVINFKGLPHRFEYAGSKDGITFINDSKSTSVGATIRALESLELPVLLIAGGRDKGSDWTLIKDLVRQKVKKVVLIGEAGPKIRKALDGVTSFKKADSMDEAVQCSYTSAVQGDCILLSPMCASFDMFHNFEERGEEFKKSVRRICGKPE